MSFSSAEGWDIGLCDMPNTSRSTAQETATGRAERVEAFLSQPYIPPPARMAQSGYPTPGPNPLGRTAPQYPFSRHDYIPVSPYAGYAARSDIGYGMLPPPPPPGSTDYTSLGQPIFQPFQPPRAPAAMERARERGRFQTRGRQSGVSPYGTQTFARGRDFSQTEAQNLREERDRLQRELNQRRSEAGFSQSEAQNLREDRDRLQRELDQSIIERARLERELISSREEIANLNGQLYMLKKTRGLHDSPQPQQAEAAFRKLSVSSMKSPEPSGSRKDSVSSPSDAQGGLDIKTTLTTLFGDIEEWSKQYVSRAMNNLGEAPTFRDVAKRILDSHSFQDVVLSPIHRKFLVAAIINEEVLKVLGAGLLKEMHIFSSNKKLLELTAWSPDLDNFEQQQEMLNKRAALVKAISSEPGWMASAEDKVNEMAGKIFTVFRAAIPEPIFHRALEELKNLMRKVLAASVKLMAMPKDWVTSAAKKGDRWEPHSMTQVDEIVARDSRLLNMSYLYQVRFGVRPSITEKSYGPSGQQVREVATKTVFLMEPSTPKKSPPKPFRGFR